MSAQEQGLQEFLTDNREYAERETFVVDNMAKADWCLRKLAKIETQDAEDTALAEAEIERIQTWLKERKEARQSDREYFTGHLTRYHAQVMAEDAKAKSIKLPHGVLKSRTTTVVDYDDKTVIAWAKQQGRPEFIRIKEELAKTAVKDAVVKDGESIPGVMVTTGVTTFHVEVLG